MKNDRLAAAEPLSAHYILCGKLKAPDRRDSHPFVPLCTYISVRCPEAPAGWNPTADVHFDDILAELLRSACRIREGLLRGTMDLIAARIAVQTLRERCQAHAKRLDDANMFGDPLGAVVDTEAASTDTARLGKLCAVSLAGCGDRDALIELAETAETCVSLGLSVFMPFAAGARVYLACDTVLGSWSAGPPLAVIKHCLEQGDAILGQYARASAGDSSRLTHAETIENDRAGLTRIPASAPEPAPEPEDQGPGVVVFPAGLVDAVGKGDNQKELKRFLGSALGARLPLTPVPVDWDEWEACLRSEAPWLAPAIHAVRTSQGGRSHWGGGVLCLEGSPGAGKSRLARRIAETSGLPFARFNCDSTSDNSALSGTPIRWLSAHPGLLEQLLSSTMSANGIVLLDEIEKCSGSRRNGGGHPHDIFHSWFEDETAKGWRSPYLLGEIDVSNVFFIATANETASVPASLRDRMRIVRVDEPQAQHLGALATTLAQEACREMGMDARFGTLDACERDVLRQAWRGGSIRRLAKLVQVVLQARDSSPGIPRH